LIQLNCLQALLWRFCHAFATAYAYGAKHSGHEVRRINIVEIEIPFLRTREEWTSEKPPLAIEKAQEEIHWAENLMNNTSTVGRDDASTTQSVF
jgi:putative NADPH-quinone reductase